MGFRLAIQVAYALHVALAGKHPDVSDEKGRHGDLRFSAFQGEAKWTSHRQSRELNLKFCRARRANPATVPSPDSPAFCDERCEHGTSLPAFPRDKRVGTAFSQALKDLACGDAAENFHRS